MASTPKRRHSPLPAVYRIHHGYKGTRVSAVGPVLHASQIVQQATAVRPRVVSSLSNTDSPNSDGLDANICINGRCG